MKTAERRARGWRHPGTEARVSFSMKLHGTRHDFLRCISASVIALVATVCAKSDTSPSSTHDGVPSESVDQRSLNLPVLPVGQRCPVSVGTRRTVPSQPHIFLESIVVWRRACLPFFDLEGIARRRRCIQFGPCALRRRRVPRENSVGERTVIFRAHRDSRPRS